MVGGRSVHTSIVSIVVVAVISSVFFTTDRGRCLISNILAGDPVSFSVMVMYVCVW